MALAGERDLSFYWEQPADGGGDFAAATGVACRVSGMSAREVFRRVRRVPVRWIGARPDAPGPWLGGFAFDPLRTGGEWTGYPPCLWILPRRALCGRNGRSWAVGFWAAHERPDLDALASWADGMRDESGRPRPPGIAKLVEDRPGWTKLVGATLEAIGRGTLAKAVAARAIEASLPEPAERCAVLAALRSRHPRCTTFLVRGGDGSSFLGATPERLLRRRGRTLETEALAGTLLTSASTSTARLDLEHGLVRHGLVQSLVPIAREVQVDPRPRHLVLRDLVHLKSRVRAVLRAGVDDGAVVAALHPTAAVGGTPSSTAVDFLRRNEGFDRGWYAGAVGWHSPEEAELRVAIRSALISGKHARIFVGAGIVAGTTADLEWEETVLKSRAILDALGGRPGEA